MTGSGQGIGKNIAAAFATEGARVVICGVDRTRGEKTHNEFIKKNYSASYYYVDLSQSGQAVKLITNVIKDLGRIDILVNNAKFYQRLTLWQESEKTWDQGMSVTLKAAFFASQEAAKRMRKDGGVIINVSSVASLLAGHDSPVYHIAKAGMLSMTRYFASVLGRYKIRVNCVLPGFIVKDEYQKRFKSRANKTYRQLSNFAQPLKRTGKSDEVAAAVLFLASSESSFITGECLIIDGGMSIQDQSDVLFSYAKLKQ